MSVGGAKFWSQQFIDAAGVPYGGVQVYHYAAGTTTAKDVWVDEGRSTLASQPVTGDSRGRVWFYANGEYRLRVEDPAGILLYDWDNIRISKDEATMWEGNRGTSYPAVGALGKGQLFALVDGSDQIEELAINDDQTAFHRIPAALKSLAYGSLPAIATAHAGWLRRVTDRTRGVWMQTATEWVSLSGETVNVKEFAAKGDGSTDDTVAIQAAMDAINAIGGGCVYFPPGTYILTQVTVGDNTWIQGAGPGATILKSTVGTAYDGILTNKDHTAGNSYIVISDLQTQRTYNTASSFNSHIMIQRGSHIIVTRCAIIGTAPATGSSGNAGKGVLLRACNYATISECYVKDIPDNALSISHGEGWASFVGYGYILNNVVEQSVAYTSSAIIPSASHSIVAGNYVKLPEADGGQCVELGDSGVTDILITANTFIGGQLLIGAGSQIRILGNNVGGSTTDTDGKISIFPTGTLSVDNVIIEGNMVQGGGIGLDGGNAAANTITDFIVARNIIRNGPATSPGLSIIRAQTTKGMVSENYIFNCKMTGLKVENCVDVVVQGNYVRNCGSAPSGTDLQHKSGIWLDATDCQVRSNYCIDNAGYGIILYNALVNCDLVDNDTRDNVLGDLRVYNASSPTPTRVVRATGDGGPENIVSATRGSLWMRNDTGQLYIKVTGTGKTGWQVVTTT